MKYNLEQHGMGWRAFMHNHFLIRKQTFQYQHNLPIFNDGVVYAFGIWSGFSLQVLSRMFESLGNEKLKILAFDVFTGIPVEENEPHRQVDDPGWYNLLDHYKVSTLAEALPLLEMDIRTNMKPSYDLTFIPGLVQNTLTDELAKTLKPASYVDFDMDIYSPTHFVLDFLFKHKLIVEGTIIGYDDWIQVEDCVTYECGESRAHKEICDKYGVKCVQLLETVNRGQAAFIVTEIAK